MRRRAQALALAFAHLVSPVRAQTTAPWDGAGLTASEFVQTVLAGRADRSAAEALAERVPGRVYAVAGAPTGPDVDELALVCWGLALVDAEYVDVLAAQMPTVRQLIQGVGRTELGRGLDEVVLHSMINAGRWSAARELADDALEAWSDDPLTFLTLRARVALQQKHWDLCRDDLDRADQRLTDGGTGSWSSVIDATGVRLQLELTLGRLDVATKALARIQVALEAGLAALGSDVESARALELACVNYEADLNLTAERNDIVVRRIDELITGPMADHAMPATILLQLALAHDGLELADPSRPSRAGEMFVRLAKDESLPRHLRIYTNLRLAIRHLTAGRPEDAATVLVEIDRLLLADDNTEAAAPLWREAGMLRLVRSRIARALGAGEQEMATHLEEVGAAYDNLLEIWAGTPLLPGGLGFLQWGDRQELLSELLTLRAAYDPRGARAGLDDLLAGEAHGSLARRLRLPIPKFEEISAALVDDGGIVAYVPSARGGHIFTIDRDRVELWDLTIKSVLDRMARDASAAAFAVDAESTRRLVEHLLPDPIVERVRAWSHVYVVGLSELPELPFESLPLGAQPGAPILGRTLPIARLPSISVGVWLARDAAETAPARPDDLALWVVPEPSLAVLARWPDLQRIPFGDDERARLQSAFGPSDGAPFLRHPSRSTLTEGSARDARVLNLWCHGAWDEASERPASLVLAPDGDDDDGLVGCGAVEVPARDYPPLVVLSACGAALGPRRPGDDGVEHLGGAFLMGGARTVLLASGELGYRAALGFTESFYDHLASGRSPAEAMRRARADSNSGAGLRLIGLAHRPLFSAPAAPASRGLPASMTVLAIVALGGWLVTRRGRPSSTPSRA